MLFSDTREEICKNRVVYDYIIRKIAKKYITIYITVHKFFYKDVFFYR